MGYEHGYNIVNSQRPKSAFVTGTHVSYATRDGRKVSGQIVGPDQDYFPSPAEVFVSFPSTGFTLLVPVDDLETASRKAEGTES